MKKNFTYSPKEIKIAHEIVTNIGRITPPQAFMSHRVCSINAFNINAKQIRENQRGDLTLYSYPHPRQKFPEELIQTNRHLIRKWKTAVSVFHRYPSAKGNPKVIHGIRIIPPEHICTGNYLICGASKSRRQAEHLGKYLETKFLRFLISLSQKSMCLSRDSFKFVPLQNFTQLWTDEMLYKKYQLTEEQIALIETRVPPYEIPTRGKQIRKKKSPTRLGSLHVDIL